MQPDGYAYDKQIAGDLVAVRYALLYNIWLVISAVVCTTVVAVFAQSAAGLWSFGILLFMCFPRVNLGAPPPHDAHTDESGIN